MEELYVVIGTDGEGCAWTCYDSAEVEVFNEKDRAESLKKAMTELEIFKEYNYQFRVAKLSFLD